MKSTSIQKKSSLFSIFFTFAVESLGATVVYPIFAPLFLNPEQGLFDKGTLLSYKAAMLGVFLGVFPLMQFLFSPVLGEYADHYGRKKALICTTFLTFAGYMVSAFSIYHRSLAFIFIGRIIMGIGAGNLSICLSSLSDLSANVKKRVRYFSYGSATVGLTFILGPFVGGKLSDPTLNPLFGPSFPMTIGTVLACINCIFILLAFKETLTTVSMKPFNFIKGFQNIKLVFKMKAIKTLYLIYFFYLFSWNIIFLFVPAFAVQNFKLSNSEIGNVCALLGIFWILGTALLHRVLNKFFSSKKVLLFAFLLFAIIIPFAPNMHRLQSFIAILALCTLISGLIWPFCTAAISNAAPPNFQGKVLGLSQSVFSLTMMIASFVGGFSLRAHGKTPFILASISSLIAGAILVRVKTSKKTT